MEPDAAAGLVQALELTDDLLDLVAQQHGELIWPVGDEACLPTFLADDCPLIAEAAELVAGQSTLHIPAAN